MNRIARTDRRSPLRTSVCAGLRAPAWAAALVAFGLLAWAGVASAAPGVYVARGDGLCPAGQLPITPARAQADADRICSSLGPWHIARLAGGGSMDGPGYGCTIRPYDGRDLGHTLCAPARDVRPVARPAPGPDVYRPRPRPDVYRPRAETVHSGRRVALQSAHGGFLTADGRGRLEADGPLRARGAVFTLIADGPVQHGAPVRLRAVDGRYAVATRKGGAVIRGGRKAERSRWTLESPDGYRWLSCGDRVNLRGDYGRYLVAEPDGRAEADRARPAAWETFTLVCL